MATYLELKAKVEKMLIEAEELRVKEIDQVVVEIKEKIALYGLSAQDLGLGTQRKPKSSTVKTTAPRYRGPEGQTWSGGRGRKPKWVTEALQKGRKLDEFAVKKS